MGGQAPSLLLIGSLVAGLGYALLAIHLVRAGYAVRSAHRVQWCLFAATLASLAWCIAVAVAEVSAYTSPVYVESGLDLLRYALLLSLMILLLHDRGAPLDAAPTGSVQSRSPAVAEPASSPSSRSALVRPLAIAAVGLGAASAAAVAMRVLTGHYELDGARFQLMSALGLAVLGLVLAEQVFRNTEPDARWSTKPLCLGLGTIFAFDLYLYAEAVLLGRLDPDARAIRPLVHLLLVPFVFMAVRRTADWSRGLQVSRRAVFYSTALLLAGGYLLFIAAVGYYVRYFGGDWGRALQIGLIFASAVALLTLILSASLRARVRVFIGKHFFSYRYDYREEWLAFTAALASNTSPQGVGVLVVRALANLLECPAGSLWTRDPTGAHYQQTASWNVPQLDTQLPVDSSLPAFLQARAWLIDVDEYRRSPAAYEQLSLPPWLLDSDKAWTLIPLLEGEQLLGWVMLAPPRTPVELDWETRDLVKTASRQAAGYLAQMQATEALLESRKFDAFNRMSAFVVHDLKNIVTQLSLMLKNAQRLKDNPEFQQDMLLTVESSLERMRRLMLQLREGAAPPEGARGVDLKGVVAKLAQRAAETGRSIEVQVDGQPATRGHEDRLERVLGHLVQNALDATPASGRVWLKVGRYSGQVRVEIGDNGQGMSEDFVRTKLFKPFSSTKRSGMGIGSYESAQYIREIGGSIEVDSAPGRGTVMAILLPLLDVRRESDLTSAAAP
jgi:putative PEP-CTERM system histidine kinase